MPTASAVDVMMPCGDRPFLAWVLRELVRYGVEDVLLLGSGPSTLPRNLTSRLPKPLRIDVIHLQSLDAVRGRLDTQFLLLRGGWWMDANLAASIADAQKSPNLVHQLGEGGLFLVQLQALDYGGAATLNIQLMSRLAGERGSKAFVTGGRVIDIATPEGRAHAQGDWSATLLRPAVFFDRDGVLNRDTGYVTRDRFEWLPGAKAAVRAVNDRGFHAFVVTNQSGVARGLFTENDVRALHDFMADQLLAAGAFIDDWFFCPHHRDGVVPEYRRDCTMRKPSPGMLNELIDRWQVRIQGSIMIGDKDLDMEAAQAAHIEGLLYDGSVALDRFLQLQDMAFTRFGSD